MPSSSGLVSLAGEGGEESSMLGVEGGVESSVYVNPDEHAEVFPAASVAVAVNVVELSSLTLTVSPGELKAAALPVAAGLPVQSADA